MGRHDSLREIVYIVPLRHPVITFIAHTPQMRINWLFTEWVPRWVKGLFRLRTPSSGIVSLSRLKNLNLQSQFGKKRELYISVKLFHPKSSVSRHAGSIYELKRQTDNDNESDSDLQRLWARDTEDLGALEDFHFISYWMTETFIFAQMGTKKKLFASCWSSCIVRHAPALYYIKQNNVFRMFAPLRWSSA